MDTPTGISKDRSSGNQLHTYTWYSEGRAVDHNSRGTFRWDQLQSEMDI